jgi:hypothetical protein
MMYVCALSHICQAGLGQEGVVQAEGKPLRQMTKFIHLPFLILWRPVSHYLKPPSMQELAMH